MNLRSAYSFLILMLTVNLSMTACRDTSREFDASQGVPDGFVVIQAGEYSVGSTSAERHAALSHTPREVEEQVLERLNNEFEHAQVDIGGFAISIYPVSIREYAEFINATQHPAPIVSREQWDEISHRSGLGLNEEGDYDKYVLPLCWKDSLPPKGRLDQPVVLINQDDAKAYCDWLSQKLERKVRLPDELESEIAAGQTPYPWGEGWKSDACHAGRNNSGATRLGTLASGKPTQDVCTTGLADYAGQVYEWTTSPASHGYAILKGAGSWLDGAFECRRATRRSVPYEARHVLVGFRVVIE